MRRIRSVALAGVALLSLAAVAFAGNSPLTAGGYTCTSSGGGTFPVVISSGGTTATINGVEYTWDSGDNRYERTPGPAWWKPVGSNTSGTYTYGVGGSQTDSGSYSRDGS